jgi:uncharacterized protein (TIGR02058 family)
MQAFDALPKLKKPFINSVNKEIVMAKTRMLHEFGMGSSLRRTDYTGAAIRALKDALWHNSITLAPAFGFPKEAMIVDVEIAVQKPDKVDISELSSVFPYGQISITATAGGLDIPKPDGSGVTIIAHAAIVVSFNMEKAA